MLAKSGRYIISKIELSYSGQRKIITDLAEVHSWSDNKKFRKNNLMLIQQSKNKKYYILPRFYGISHFGLPNKNKILLRNGEIMTTPMEDNYELRQYQIDIVDIVTQHYHHNYGGYIVLPTGSGKTVIAIYTAIKIGKKTLIVVGTKALARQWQSEIKKITNTTTPIISNLNTSIKAEKAITESNFVISVINSVTMISHKFTWKTFLNIGYVIIDEIHGMISKNYLSIFNKISRRYILGLTATPSRKDGLEFLLNYYIGPCISEHDSTYSGKLPKVHLFYYANPDYQKLVLRESGSVDYMKTLSYLNEDPLRLDKTVELIVKYSKISNRLLVISHLRKNLEELYSKIIPTEPNTGIYYSVTTKTEIVKQKKTLETAKIILAIFSLSKQSLDIKDCDCIILLSSPKTHITKEGLVNTVMMDQICGRCLRKNHTVSPIIVVFNDDFSFFRNHSRMRKKYFESKNWDIINI